MTSHSKEVATYDNLAKSKRKSRLSTHRRKTHNAVKERERGRCGICKWNPGSDMHHIYGRGVSPDDWKEAVESVMWVCRNCHPHGFIHAKGDDPELESILAECVIGTRFTWEQPIGEDYGTT